MIELDGSHGEGGGQIIRSSLSLSLCTGRPFRVVDVRANRRPPGLKPQHLTAVRAAAEVGSARVLGDAVGSRELTFHPGPVRAGRYRFDVGTAGSAVLVLQTVLPPLLLADGPSTVEITGGTHNQHAPPAEFLAETFLPLLARLGCDVRLEVRRRGFYPVGGGKLRAEITPAKTLATLDLSERGDVSISARSIVSRLPSHVAERELAVVAERLGVPAGRLEVVTDQTALGPGNALLIRVETESHVEIVSAVGSRGVPAERVAAAAVDEAEAWLACGAPVGPHLADQLLLPLALGQGGHFVTCSPPTPHALTNAEVIHRFLGTEFRFEDREGTTEVEVRNAECGVRSDRRRRAEG